ncbi:hypothetical protein NX722_20495 [Endozoicomonas gorgoniicola]|uniref:Tetratricopeptide repeat protein n=1 Tax=Endozoicomonas gorgoniicola TaxID=1234144 RepID=A0ABT3MZZ9_9GAMM|nr:hypothetical protein [Endozoicomonas gorgoniicola]MCW7554955.1 hypothetical protein [Endozoicomonas gorgoniicola]
MNKNELFFCVFVILFSITGFAGVNCEQCGHEYEGESCPYEEQHLLLLDQLDALIGSDNESTSEACSMNSGDSFNHFYLDPGWGSLPVVTYFPNGNSVMLLNAAPPKYSEYDSKQLYNSFKLKADRYCEGSLEWISVWQEAYAFAMADSYNINYLFLGVTALAKLQRFNEALNLLEYIKTHPVSQIDAKVIKRIIKQENFIYHCIEKYDHN